MAQYVQMCPGPGNKHFYVNLCFCADDGSERVSRLPAEAVDYLKARRSARKVAIKRNISCELCQRHTRAPHLESIEIHGIYFSITEQNGRDMRNYCAADTTWWRRNIFLESRLKDFDPIERRKAN